MANKFDKTKLDWLSTLPSDIADLLTSMEFSDILGDIGVKYDLFQPLGPAEIAGVVKLSDLVTAVLKGESPLEEFRENLKKELAIGPETAKEIADEVEDRVFSKVKNGLKNLYSEKKKVAEILAKEAQPEKKPRSAKTDVYRERVE